MASFDNMVGILRSLTVIGNFGTSLNGPPPEDATIGIDASQIFGPAPAPARSRAYAYAHAHPHAHVRPGLRRPLRRPCHIGGLIDPELPG